MQNNNNKLFTYKQAWFHVQLYISDTVELLRFAKNTLHSREEKMYATLAVYFSLRGLPCIEPLIGYNCNV